MVKKLISSLINGAHERFVFDRRTQVLADLIAKLLPSGSVLDVGCGDGLIDVLIREARPDLEISGVDVLIRPSTRITVQSFNGRQLPFGDRSFDTVMFVDVLHHTDDAIILLNEARRVAQKMVILKDHTMDGLLAYETLRFMDWIGNSHHGVALPYNYWPERRWNKAFAEVGLRLTHWEGRIPLYPFPASLIFGRGLHFIAALVP
jgi:ubiquinone/menaquinone biosynthesis C-methylase UbiE